MSDRQQDRIHRIIPIALIMAVGALPGSIYLLFGFEPAVVFGFGLVGSIVTAHSLGDLDG